MKESLKSSKVSEISRESKQQRRESSSQKFRTKKVKCITSRKGIADTFGEFYKRLYEDSGKDNSEHDMRDDKKYMKSRLKNYKAQSANSKLASLQTEMEYEPKTSKIATMRREK